MRLCNDQDLGGTEATVSCLSRQFMQDTQATLLCLRTLNHDVAVTLCGMLHHPAQDNTGIAAIVESSLAASDGRQATGNQRPFLLRQFDVSLMPP